MKRRPAGPLRSNIRKPQDTAECIAHRAGGESLPFAREQVIVRSRDKAAPVEIAVESLHHGRMATARGGFCRTWCSRIAKDTVGQTSVEPKVSSASDYAQSRAAINRNSINKSC